MVDFYPSEYDHGCSKYYYVDVVFEYMDNTLNQINQDFQVRGLLYSEEEIWYFIQESLNYLESYFQRSYYFSQSQKQNPVSQYGFLDCN
jgi:hypothetical protein